MFKKTFKKGQKGQTGRRKKSLFIIRKNCRFCEEKIEKIDYKNIGILSKYTTEQGKILPKRISGNCSYHQRETAKAIKQARAVSLLSYVRE